MHRKIAMVGVLVAVSAAGCGGAEESSEPGTPYGGDEADNAPQRFTVRLDRATTAENVIPQIVAAARGPLASMCEEHPGASLRIMNPLASEAYQDVPCTSVLGGDSATGEANAALVSDENDGPIGTVQQKWSPFGLVCSALTIGSSLVANYALCPKAINPTDEKHCRWVSDGGFGTLSFLCFLS